MEDIRDKLNRVLEVILIMLLSIMVLNVSWQVFSRYVLANPSSFTDELARYLMIWLGVLGTAYVSGKRLHVAIDILHSQLSLSSQKTMQKVIFSIVILATFLIFIIGGSRLVYLSYLLGQKSAALQIPLYLVYVCVPLSGACIIFYKINDLISNKS
ncbi:MAG TPA: TRAP transporter small permease [Flavobacteriales bacterium]|mgnify:FL=1|jgi:TRAP-type C4-dicarboxylate transport system permease small subunit|nr:TRAP transporter small permease [Flavobacteriales bacterium]|tara:strand:- start:2548 stop:3015 length:468 start_codon:yes stop_codon:yes gene_type:complete